MPEPRRTDNGSQSGAEGGRVATAVSILRGAQAGACSLPPTDGASGEHDCSLGSAKQRSILRRIAAAARQIAFSRPQFFADCYDTNCAGEKIKISPRVRSKNVAIARADLLNRSRRPTVSVWRIKKHTIGGQACKIHRATFLRSARSHQFSLLTRPTGRACRVGPRARYCASCDLRLESSTAACPPAGGRGPPGASDARCSECRRRIDRRACATRERASCPFTAE